MTAVATFSLEGQTALVTGAGSGIGSGIASALAGAGAHVVALGRSGSVERTRDDIERSGGTATVARVDLRDSIALEETATALLEDAAVDILVNCAGVIDRGPFLTGSTAEWDELMAVNLAAPRILSHVVGAAMVERGRGKIINIASLLSFQGGREVAAYTTSKHALVGLTKALANEWAPHGVQVNAIAPGYIATDNTAPLRADASRSAEILARIPSGRWGRPEDLAGAAVFLASGASDYITGHVLVVDGGWLSR
jgi:2-dehydro-3-deoxy-D-gluconate 5-dehydrogenase